MPAGLRPIPPLSSVQAKYPLEQNYIFYNTNSVTKRFLISCAGDISSVLKYLL